LVLKINNRTQASSITAIATLRDCKMSHTLDVVIIGCGISGISSAYHIQRHCPSKSWVVLERRKKLGGTWDFFNYPGIRSDSDMYTFGYNWKPWTNNTAISPKHEILRYLNEAVDEHSLRSHISFNTNVISASFSTKTKRWKITAHDGVIYNAQYVMFNTGYFSYETPYIPEFKGIERYQGRFVHPQEWPEDIDVKNKKIVVIGSGATAATLIPALVNNGASMVTMLQRSPTYFVSRPKARTNDMYNILRPWVGETVAYYAKRWQSIFLQWVWYEAAQRYKTRARKLVIGEIRKQCPDGFDVDTHFNPSYGVWDQRLCLVPDGDFFKCLREGTANICTDHIEALVDNGIQTQGGDVLDADIIVSATGLTLQQNFPMSTIRVDVDGVVYDAPNHFIYRGCMISEIPNFFFTIGYANAGWTLKADLIAMYFCDTINHCQGRSFASFCPSSKNVEENIDSTLLGLNSGYLNRAAGRMPKQGREHPWIVSQNVVKDFYRYKISSFPEDLIFEQLEKTVMQAKM
jgi:monooxygenase